MYWLLCLRWLLCSQDENTVEDLAELLLAALAAAPEDKKHKIITTHNRVRLDFHACMGQSVCACMSARAALVLVATFAFG